MKDKINLLICGHDLKFITPLIERCRNNKLYNVRILEHQGHLITDEIAANEGLEWADVIFCEWALGNAVWFSQRKRSEQVLIVRLHLQEVQARDRISFIWEINWKKVDRLILITDHLYDWMRKEFPMIASKCSLIYNPIPAKENFDLPKSIDCRFVLGFVGIVPARKRLDVAVAVLKKLREKNKRFILRVKGAMPSDYPWMATRITEMDWYNQIFDEISYLREVGGIVFDPHSPDMAEWYRNVGHILSVSDFEGSHQAVAEGMATGCVPTVRNWEGASKIYPAKYVGNSIESLTMLIEKHSQIEQFEYESNVCRFFAQEQFDQKMICDKIEAVIHREIIDNEYSLIRANSQIDLRRYLPTFLIIAYIPIDSRSGYRIRVEQEIQIMIKEGCKVHLVCLIPKPILSQEKEQEYFLKSDLHTQELAKLGCKVHLLEVSDFFRLHTDFNSFPSVVESLKQIIQAYNIDVVHAEAQYCARIGQQIKHELPEIMFSIDWHGVTPEESRMGGSHINRIMALENSEQELLAKCDLNIFVSAEMEVHYRNKYKINSLNYLIVPCCVSNQKFVDLINEEKLPSNDEKLIFGYLGSMADWQCGQEMISLFADLLRYDSRCYFELLVPKAEQQKVLEYALKFGLPETSYVLKEVPSSEVSNVLKNWDIGLLLRKDDPVNRVSSPTKFGEYLAVGIPVLMTECIGDFSKLVSDHSLGFIISSNYLNNAENGFDYATIKNIVDFVDNIKRNKTEFAIRSQSIVRDQLSWKDVANSWIKKYKYEVNYR